MADDNKAKSAKERLAAAKKAAVDAEVVAPKPDSAAPKERSRSSEEAREHAAESALNAAEKLAAEAASGPKDAGKDTTKDGVKPGPDTPKVVAAAAVVGGAGDKVSGTDSSKGTSAAAKPSDAKPSDTTKDKAEKTPEAPKEAAKPKPAPSKPAPAGKSFAATVLQWLVIALVISVAALWAAPRIAPHLPAWAAPVTAFLTPGTDQVTARIAEAEAASEARIAALSDRIAEMEAALADTSQVSDAVAMLRSELTARIEEIEDAPQQDLSVLEASIDTAAGRVTAAEATLEGLRAEIDALNGITGNNAAPAAETLERVAAFGASVEGLRSELGALSNKVAEIDTLAPQQEVSALAARVDALEGGEAATANARGEADSIRRQANLDAALAGISQALASGAPFDGPLGQAVNLSGEPAPDALVAVAPTGAPTTDSLIRSFGPAAQAGYAAALSADAGDGFGERLLARLEGRIGGRPAVETEGDDAGAVLSRIEARLGEGRLDAARSEAAALPEDAANAMSGWLTALAKADDARRGLSDWRAALAAN